MAAETSSDGAGTGATLASRLEAARRRRFVGRDAELELVRAALASDHSAWAVLAVHGPGGVGKTALLDRIAGEARAIGVPALRVDLRAIDPSPAGLLAALAAELGAPDGASACAALRDGRRRLLLLDTCEAAPALAPWLRERFLPDVGEATLVVMAGRDRPDPAWTADPGWAEIVRVVALRNLDTGDAAALLRARGVDDRLHDRLVAVTHGHPLALALLADVLRQSPDGRASALELADAPDALRVLLDRFAADAPSGRHRAALEVCAHARVTTEALLRDALGGDDAGELFTWLRELSFVEDRAEGIAPHDLARDVLEADLRWRDDAAFRRVHRNVRRHVVERLRTASGTDRRRAELDLVFLHRGNPTVRGFWEWTTLGAVEPGALRDGDVEPIVAMVDRFEGEASAAIVRRWLGRQPEAFVVFRGAGEAAPVGFVCWLALHRATDEDLAADPGARAMWAYAQAHGAPRPGEEVHAGRMLVDGEAYQAPSRTLNGVTAHSLVHWLSHPRLAWDFIGCWAQPDAVAPLMEHIDYARVPEADYEVGGRRFGVFAHDWRRVGIDAWLDKLAEREIGAAARPDAARAAAPELALSRGDFTAAVRAALRDLHRPGALAANPLARSRAVLERDPSAAPGEALEALVREAVAALAADPRAERLARVVDRTYVRPAPTQERAAELLGLPSSTYRRHLRQAVERVAGWLWERELYGQPAP